MVYLPEIETLAIRYPYPYDVCEYVYLAHGSKAEEILKVGAEKKLPGFWVMGLSDLCYTFVDNDPDRNLEVEIDNQPVINLNERILRNKGKEDKLPRKFRKGWK